MAAAVRAARRVATVRLVKFLFGLALTVAPDDKVAALEADLSATKAAVKRLEAEHKDGARELEELRAVKKDQLTKIKQLEREVEDLNNEARTKQRDFKKQLVREAPSHHLVFL